MSEFERSITGVTEIKIDDDGIDVFWLDEHNHYNRWQVSGFFQDDFSIIGKTHKNRPYEITIKFKD